MEASKERKKVSTRVDAPDADVQMAGRAIELPTHAGKTSTVHCKTSHWRHCSPNPYNEQTVDSISWRGEVKKQSTKRTLSCLASNRPFLIVADQACECSLSFSLWCNKPNVARLPLTHFAWHLWPTCGDSTHSTEGTENGQARAHYIFKYRFWREVDTAGGGIGVHTHIARNGRTVSLVGHSVPCCQQQLPLSTWPASTPLVYATVAVVIMSATHWRPIAPLSRNLGQNVIKGALTSNN